MKRRIVRGVAAVALLALLVLGIVKRELIRVILCNNLLAVHVALDESESWAGGSTYTGVPYAGDSPAQYLDLYVPESDEPMPLIVMIHGGGFWFGDTKTRQTQLMYRYFRDHGYACASIGYRLSSEATYPAAVEDVKAAIRFLRANAQRYGYDPERFVTWGESAGGYLSCMAALTDDTQFTGVRFIGEDALSAPVSGRIQVLTQYYGAVELGTMERDWRTLGIPQVVRDIANSWLREPIEQSGGRLSSCEEVFLGRRISDMTDAERELAAPGYYLDTASEETLPGLILVWHGDADITVPYLQSERFAARATARVGADRVDYRLLRGYGHASDGFYSEETLGVLKQLLDEATAR